jgi:hypothetical protein
MSVRDEHLTTLTSLDHAFDARRAYRRGEVKIGRRLCFLFLIKAFFLIIL